ncbi:MAG: Asp-tRNA(Asn)/Glu-tRNA(Gln) amidotransferase subunit GatC [Candidatus Staskawiczbacteria bacterium]|nr:Asp-tRNA(Asn)/Glu-tRNA(Gln) amidotransferase subunit GatC [Candidatus Staskawiczbacteria bacterium]
MISKEEVRHIAKLARLELTEEEITKMQKDLSQILDYFDLLKSATAPLKQGSGETRKANVLRLDEAMHSQLSDKIIEAAPDKKDGYYKVKTIL